MRTTLCGRAARRLRHFWRGPEAVLGLSLFLVFAARPCRARPAAAAGSAPEDLAGRAVNPLRAAPARATVFIFIRTDCPVSSRYAPEIQRLEAEFIPHGVVFWLVDPDSTESPSTIRQYLKQYGYADAGHVLRDPAHVLVAETGVTITPEAAVFTSARRMAYRGRIDNWFVSLGRARPAATTHDLQAALTAVLAGRPVARKTTPAVGCFISDMQ